MRERADATVLRAFARFATLSIAIKAASIHHMEDRRPLEPTPTWARRKTRGRLVMRLLRERYPNRSRPQIADELEVKLGTLKSWESGAKRPSFAHLDVIAREVRPASHRFLLAELSRHYALSDITDALRGFFRDEDFVDELATVFCAVRERRLITLESLKSNREEALGVVGPFEMMVFSFISLVMDESAFLAAADHHAWHWRESVETALALWRPWQKMAEVDARLRAAALTLGTEHRRAVGGPPTATRPKRTRRAQPRPTTVRVGGARESS